MATFTTYKTGQNLYGRLGEDAVEFMETSLEQP